jgi:hypothetical protein
VLKQYFSAYKENRSFVDAITFGHYEAMTVELVQERRQKKRFAPWSCYADPRDVARWREELGLDP